MGRRLRAGAGRHSRRGCRGRDPRRGATGALPAPATRPKLCPTTTRSASAATAPRDRARSSPNGDALSLTDRRCGVCPLHPRAGRLCRLSRAGQPRRSPGQRAEPSPAHANTRWRENDTCRACHDRVFKTYEAQRHAIRVREGKTAAPVCGDCHPPHGVAPVSVQDGPTRRLPGVPRRHRRAARAMAAECGRAICAPWPARPATRPTRCGGWTCGCTSGRAAIERPRRIAAVRATRPRGRRQRRRPRRERIARACSPISSARRRRSRCGVASSCGPASEAHELPGKARAIRDCVNCHDESAAPFQNVTVSILDAERQARALRRPQGSPELADHLGCAARLLRDRRHAVQAARHRAGARPRRRHRGAGLAPAGAATVPPPPEQ